MKNMILPAFLLLLSPLFVHAADAVAPDPAGNSQDPAAAQAKSKRMTSAESAALADLNKNMKDTSVLHAKTQACFDLENSLRSDLTRKRAELNAEFHGKTPNEFVEMLSRKQLRLERQHKACAQQYDDLGKAYEALMQWFRGYEPKTLNVKKQKALVDEQKEKYLLMQPTAKPYNKVHKKAKAQD